MRQLSLTLENGLLQQFPEFRDVVRASVYSCGRPFKAIAADMDMSLSELSRKLAENSSDPVHFPLTRLPDLVRATGDTRPIMWMVETFLDDPNTRREHALDRLNQLLPEIAALVKESHHETPIRSVK